MEAMGVDLGVFLETKLTGGIYTRNLSEISVLVSNDPSLHQGGIALFWWANKAYNVEDWRIRGPNMLSFVVVTGSQRFYVVGYYIPPTVLSTLPQVEQALKEFPTGQTPLLIRDLNDNLHTPRDERDKRIAEVVEDICRLTDLSKHFRQLSCGHTRGR
jgi:hypothetical protein